MERTKRNRIWKRVVLGALIVVALPCIPLAYWTRGLAFRAELDYPELGRTVMVDGFGQHYMERGKGRPVVLLHGAFGALQDYTATIFDPLTRKYRAIAFDRPGHGYSERPTNEVCTPAVQARILHDALRELGVERPVLVGFSWSGAEVLSYALAYPRDVAGIVTINGVTHPWPTRTSLLYEVPPIPILGTLFTHTLVMPLGKSMMRDSIARAFDPDPVPLLFKSSPVRLELRPSSFAANAEDIRVLKDAVREQSPRYGEISVPLVIVVGEGDKVSTPELHSHALHAEVPGSVLVQVPDGGHQLLYTHAKVILAAIDRAWQMAGEREDAAVSASSSSK